MPVLEQQLTVKESAEARRSIRKYTDHVVPKEDLAEILRIAGLAPSPFNVQPWRVVVVQEADLKQRLMEASYNQPQVGGASAVFVIYSDMDDALANIEDTISPGYPEERREGVKRNVLGSFANMTPEQIHQWGFAESNIFLGFLLLAAQSKGYGTSPMLGFEAEKVKQLLGMPASCTLPALVAIGVPAEDGFPHFRHPLDRFVTWK